MLHLRAVFIDVQRCNYCAIMIVVLIRAICRVTSFCACAVGRTFLRAHKIALFTVGHLSISLDATLKSSRAHKLGKEKVKTANHCHLNATSPDHCKYADGLTPHPGASFRFQSACCAKINSKKKNELIHETDLTTYCDYGLHHHEVPE